MRVTTFLLLLFFSVQSFALSLSLSPSSIGCGTTNVSGSFDCAFSGSIILNVSGGVDLDAPTSIVTVTNGNFDIDLIVDGGDSSPFTISGIVLSGNMPCATTNTSYSENMTHTCVYPPNDDCADAKVLTIGDLICNYELTDTDNTQSSTTPSCGGAGYVDLWYEFECVGNEITLELGTFPGNVIYYAMFESSCGGTQVACGLLTTFGSDFVTVTGLTDGLDYKIQILHITSASGPDQEVCIYTDLAASGSLALGENDMNLNFYNDEVILDWEDELKDGDYYEIFKSIDGYSHFEKIEVINDLDVLETNFSFVDRELEFGAKHYYQVKKMNAHDNEIYSMSNSIYLSESSSRHAMNDVQIWPNPSKGDLMLSMLNDKTENVYISIYNLEGKQLLQFEKLLEPGANVLSLPELNLNTGLYNIVMKSPRNRTAKRIQII